jgi:uncharacterized membrane protein YvbJ
MKSPKCEADNREGRIFCHKCGEKLVLVCDKCGYENLPGEKFCGKCGRDLREPARVPSVDYDQPQFVGRKNSMAALMEASLISKYVLRVSASPTIPTTSSYP